MRLVMVRHGESHHGLRGVIGGAAGCTGLTERGAQQARALADRLQATGELGLVATLVSSPWPRARETAALLVPAMPSAAVELEAGLCELDPGEADGLSWEDYRVRYGGFDLQEFPDRPFAPGGESWTAYTDRVESTLRRLAERFGGQTVVAVTHGGFIVTAFLALFGAGDHRRGRIARLDPAHTSLTEWRVTGTRWQLTRYNDTHHLTDQR